jgi:NADH-quinone oxidoreductase subunit L
MQTGKVQAYAFSMVIGLLAVGWFFFTPRAEAMVSADHLAGSYSIKAAPGPGYAYRWDADGDGKWDGNQKFGGQREVSFELGVDQSRDVRLQVRNAFGLVSTKTVSLARPKPDLSGADPDATRMQGSPAPAAPRGAPAPRGAH